jgi:Spy/CpxP family protein refolding chaperone
MEKAELTELERLRMENIALKYRAMEAQMAALLNDRRAVIEQIESAHAGWKWNDQLGGLAPLAVVTDRTEG